MITPEHCYVGASHSRGSNIHAQTCRVRSGEGRKEMERGFQTERKESTEIPETQESVIYSTAVIPKQRT